MRRTLPSSLPQVRRRALGALGDVGLGRHHGRRRLRPRRARRRRGALSVLSRAAVTSSRRTTPSTRRARLFSSRARLARRLRRIARWTTPPIATATRPRPRWLAAVIFIVVKDVRSLHHASSLQTHYSLSLWLAPAFFFSTLAHANKVHISLCRDWAARVRRTRAVSKRVARVASLTRRTKSIVTATHAHTAPPPVFLFEDGSRSFALSSVGREMACRVRTTRRLSFAFSSVRRSGDGVPRKGDSAPQLCILIRRGSRRRM